MPLNAVPYIMSAGLFQVIIGVISMGTINCPKALGEFPTFHRLYHTVCGRVNYRDIVAILVRYIYL